MEDAARRVALSPPRAFGPPPASGRLRTEPEDFFVEEDLGFAPTGEGQHILLKVRKRGANTLWVAGELARAAGCRPADVGFAGLKDRQAVAVQWFSVPRGRWDADGWRGLATGELAVLEAVPHARKLSRGALAGNRFRIRIRALAGDLDALRERLEGLRSRGVPNYFGPQRFGRGGANLYRIEAPRPPRPRERAFVLSAARSLVFNAVLAERVEDGTWERLRPGDIANLDGRGSIFAVGSPDAELEARCARLEIHPTGPLWGEGEPASAGDVRALETRVAAAFPAACRLTAGAGMRQERRSLRLAVRELEYALEDGDLVVGFRLPRGSFATTVLREVVDSGVQDEGGEDA